MEAPAFSIFPLIEIRQVIAKLSLQKGNVKRKIQVNKHFFGNFAGNIAASRF
jgi:hypothetical protein